MTGFSYPRYLAAKKSVDDRALNRQVWAALQRELTRLETGGAEGCEGGCLKVLEVGAGIGTMIERLFEWGSLKEAEYTALDASAENIAEACQRLPAWGDRNGYRVTHPEPQAYRLEKPGLQSDRSPGDQRPVRLYRAALNPAQLGPADRKCFPGPGGLRHSSHAVAGHAATGRLVLFHD